MCNLQKTDIHCKCKIFEVFIVLNIYIVVFCVVPPCSPVGGYLYNREICHIHHQSHSDFNAEVEVLD